MPSCVSCGFQFDKSTNILFCPRCGTPQSKIIKPADEKELLNYWTEDRYLIITLLPNGKTPSDWPSKWLPKSQIGEETVNLQQGKLLGNVQPNEFVKFLMKSFTKGTKVKFNELSAIEGLSPEKIEALPPRPAAYEQNLGHSKLLAGVGYLLFITLGLLLLVFSFRIIPVVGPIIYGVMWLWLPCLLAVIGYYRHKAAKTATLTINGVKLHRDAALPKIYWKFPELISYFKLGAESDRLICPNCTGQGQAEYKCPRCSGSGKETITHTETKYGEDGGSYTWKETVVCTRCGGKGWVMDTCKICRGYGGWNRNGVINDYNAFAERLNGEIAQFIRIAVTKKQEVTSLIAEVNRKVDLWNERLW